MCVALRKSCVKKGYMKDDYIHLFVRRPVRRSPIINPVSNLELFFLILQKIKNPNYKGKWTAPMIDNPDFKDDPDLYDFPNLKYVGIELWQVKSGTMFDNILVAEQSFLELKL